MNKSKRLEGIEELLGIRVSEDGEQYVDNIREGGYSINYDIRTNNINLLKSSLERKEKDIERLFSLVSKLTKRLESLEQHLKVEYKVIPSIPETTKHVKIEKKGK